MKQILLFLVIILCLAACTQDLVTGKKSYNWFSLEDDVQMGTQVMSKQLASLKKDKKSFNAPKDAADLQRIRTIVKRIAKVSHFPKFPYEVHLADLPVVNAWCAPGGKMMVYTGLWDKKNGLVSQASDDELAAVLGHELAHATARHVTESLSRNVTIAAAGSAATSIIGVGSAEGADLFGEIFSHGVNVYVPSYSRKNELEADRLGLIYMAKAGYDPRAAVRLWERAAKRRGNRTSIYASHPPSGARAEQLKQYLPEAMRWYHKSK